MNEYCGCCAGIEEETPAPIANRPQLDAVSYRVGTYAHFLATMQSRLTTHFLEIPTRNEQGNPRLQKIRPLQDLTTRDSNDPTMALLDAWAIVADVLTFYQERIANEGFLRTATERRSVLELARLVGYSLRPGVAASVRLAYEVEASHPGTTIIPAGSRVQSVPGPGELPQTFETSAPLTARAEWNAITPRLTRPQRLTPDHFDDGGKLYLKGITTNLKPGSPLLLDFSNDQKFYRVTAVEPDAVADRTTLTLEPWLTKTPLDRTIRAIQDVAIEFRNLSEYDVDDTRRAQELLATLDWLAHPSPSLTRRELMRTIEGEVLPRLQAELEEVRARNFVRLERWLGELVPALEQAVTTQQRQDATIGDLGGLIRKLEKAPSVPPANARQLKRSLDRAFATDSNTPAQLLSSIRPDIGKTLYAGWQNLPVSVPVLVESYALRTQAGVFGGNAPKQPNGLSEDGRVTFKEWALKLVPTREPKEVTIRIMLSAAFPENTGAMAASGDPTFAATLDIMVGSDHIQRESLSLPVSGEPIPLPVGGEAIELSLRRNVEFPGYELWVIFAQRDEGREQPYFILAFTVDRNSFVVSTQSANFDWISIESSVEEGDEVGSTTALNVTAQGWIPGYSAVDTPEVANDDAEATNIVWLDVPNNEILPGSWVVVERPIPSSKPPQLVISRVRSVKQGSRASYNISGKSTRLELTENWLNPEDTSFATLRGTTIYGQSEKLELAEEPIEEPICGGCIPLGQIYDGLESGRWLIVSGERADIPGVAGVPAAELVMLAGVRQTADSNLPGDRTHSELILANDLAYCYTRASVKIYANVVHATHGETREEVLGSGDGSQALQSFALRQPPLTFVAAPTPEGVESTLQVRINDVRWHEADNLSRLGPTDQRFITRTDDAGTTSVLFGNGQRGARLPTGIENVRATYRNGIGKGGNVTAEQISLVVTRPLGVKGVLNPLAATGGADRESRDQARKNAPLGVTALDRLVSVQDYADFARTFAGIAKASAVRLSDGQRRIIHLTIAGIDDISIAEVSDLYQNLRRALLQFGDPHLPVRIDLRERLVLVFDASVKTHPDYLWEAIEPQVRARLLDAFSFERRELAQDALLSEAIAAIHTVPGVEYVDVDAFGGINEKTVSGGQIRTLSPKELAEQVRAITKRPRPEARVVARSTGRDNGTIQPAQIAFLLPDVADTLMLRRLPS